MFNFKNSIKFFFPALKSNLEKSERFFFLSNFCNPGCNADNDQMMKVFCTLYSLDNISKSNENNIKHMDVTILFLGIPKLSVASIPVGRLQTTTHSTPKMWSINASWSFPGDNNILGAPLGGWVGGKRDNCEFLLYICLFAYLFMFYTYNLLLLALSLFTFYFWFFIYLFIWNNNNFLKFWKYRRNLPCSWFN